ncbi:hypothetical protein HK102_002578 [Quaeritorhiza haematococci]|nr:hypothetical protein HK102_002578 [Quaeritorhiza haematococci]
MHLIAAVCLLLLYAGASAQNANVTTVKIGFMWGAKPSWGEDLDNEQLATNERLMPAQAFVDHWNLQSPNVKWEIDYGSHQVGMIPETLRFAGKERIAFFVGDTTDFDSITQQTILSKFNILQCSTEAGGDTRTNYASNFLNDPAQAPTFMTTRSSPAQFGAAVATLFEHLQLNRVVIIYDEWYNKCKERVEGFIVNARMRSITVLWSTQISDSFWSAIDKQLFGPFNSWAETIRRIRALKARVIVHCGRDGVYYDLLKEAANQGLMQENRTLFTLLDLNSGVVNGTEYADIAPYMYGALVIRPATRENDIITDPYPQYMREVVRSLSNTTVKLLSPRPVTLDSARYAGCVRVLIPTITELVRRGNITWEQVARGELLSRVRMTDVLAAATNNRTMVNRGFFITNTTRLGTLEGIERTGNGSTLAQIARLITFPDGTSTPPRVNPLTIERERSFSLALGIFLTTLVLEVAFIATLVTVFINRTKPAVKRNSFIFLSLIIVGCILQLASALPAFFEIRDTVATCESRDYLNHFGFAMTFTAIILKEYRLYRIFENKSAVVVKLPDPILLRYYFGVVPIALIILLVDTFANGFRLREDSRQIDELTTEIWSVCGISSISYVLLGLEFVMLTLGSILAWMTRNVRDEYNEARSLGISVYNSLFLLIVAVVLQSVVTPTYESEHMIHFLRVAITTVTIVGAMCAPKLAPEFLKKLSSAASAGKKYYGKQSASVGAVSSVPSHFAAPAPASAPSTGGAANKEDPERVALLKELEDLKALETKLVKEVDELSDENKKLKAELGESEEDVGNEGEDGSD